jgi:hypothetical protein
LTDNQKIKLERLKADEFQLVQELKRLGLKVESVYDLVNNKPIKHIDNKFIGEYSQAYTILVQHLDKPHEKTIREGIIRALTEKNAKSVAQEKLLEQFYKEQDPMLKWVLANALKIILTQSEKKKHPDVKAVLKHNWGFST